MTLQEQFSALPAEARHRIQAAQAEALAACRVADEPWLEAVERAAQGEPLPADYPALEAAHKAAHAELKRISNEAFRAAGLPDAFPANGEPQ